MSGHSNVVAEQDVAEAPFDGAAAAGTASEDIRDALTRYFDLMYDCDVGRLDEVFAPSAQLHGYRDGEMTVWSREQYRKVLAERTPPKSMSAPREDEVLMIDLASHEMAFTKVRLRIGELRFVDYLTWHGFGGRWLVTSKGFHALA